MKPSEIVQAEVRRQEADARGDEIRQALRELNPYARNYVERRAALLEALLNEERAAGASDRPVVGGVLR